jgi:putative restriction endonuclease
VRFWVGVTDKNWFQYLRARRPDEVNFWQPSARPLAAFLEPGVPFLFKLHAPDDYIVGGGFFLRFSALPARLAWEAFLDDNGVTDYASLKRRIEQYRNEPLRGDPEIGCNILNAPFFFDEKDWIPVPADWAKNIVRGKTYDTAETVGLRLWNQVEGRLQASPDLVLQAHAAARYGAEYLTRARIGQGAFRILVTEAYRRKCAVSGERTLPVLEAAHIRPYGEQGPHLVSNGLLLRSDIHKLYDEGYLTVTDDLRVEVSRKIKEEFENGRDYYAFHGKPLVELPLLPDERPRREFLRWHNEHLYLG